jgi:hypothetical protein
MSFWANVFLDKCPSGQTSSGQMYFWENVFLGKLPSGQMSSGQMSFWANVFWSNVFLVKCLMVKCLSGQMSFWANVFWANVVLSKCLRANLYGQMSFGQMSYHRQQVPIYRTVVISGATFSLSYVIGIGSDQFFESGIGSKSKYSFGS